MLLALAKYSGVDMPVDKSAAPIRGKQRHRNYCALAHIRNHGSAVRYLGGHY